MPARTAAALILSASSHSPIATSASIWFVTSPVTSIPKALEDVERLRGDAGRFPYSTEHRQHVGEPHVCTPEIRRIAVLLGESNGRPELTEAFFTAPEIREVDSEHRQRDELGLPCPDLTRERQRLLRDHA